jgi:predicted kinase
MFLKDGTFGGGEAFPKRRTGTLPDTIGLEGATRGTSAFPWERSRCWARARAGWNEFVTSSMPRRIVIVSGPPAAGKTAVAVPLAEGLGFALIAKDDIKESLYASLNGLPGDVAFSRILSDASMHLLWRLAARCPHAVLEANFRTTGTEDRETLAALLAGAGTRCVEVHCRIPLAEAARRFAERARAGRHSAHALQEMSLERLAAYAEPFALSPVIEVDTTRPVDIAALVDRVRGAL